MMPRAVPFSLQPELLPLRPASQASLYAVRLPVFQQESWYEYA